MPRIPNYLSDGQPAGVPSMAPAPLADAQQMGAGIGAAQQGVGAALISTGVAVGNFGQELQKKQDNLETVNAVAKFDFTKQFLDMKTAMPADPKEFELNVANGFDAAVDKYVNDLPVNETVRTAVKAKLITQRQHYTSSASSFATTTLDAKDKLDANEGVKTQVNRVRVDGSIDTFNDASKKIDDVIDAQPGIQTVVKNGMKKAAQEDLARRRFEGMIEATKDDPIALEGVKNELQDEFWQKKMSTKDYDAMLDQVEKRTRSANSAEAAAGRAALQDLRKDDGDGKVIDDARLAGAREAVNKSNRAELQSQMAMIERRQQVFKIGYTLPPAEQRAALEKASKAKGIDGLPEPIKQGIAEGVRITNGQVSAEYLAGIVNGEYGHQVGSGNYGVKNPGGKSDATGVTQFISTTFVDVVRKNAELLGVDVAGKSDADIVAMRKDPVLSIKAAALYAMQNKRELQNMSSRDLTDGDLYMSHFLGTKGGARFLDAADANPRGFAVNAVAKDQVDANPTVFYVNGDKSKPRTNQDVRAYMTQAMMNGPSRVDYSEARAWQTVIGETQRRLRDDAMSFAASTGKFGDIGNMQTPEGIQRRGIAAQQVAEFYGVPTDSFKPFTKDEIEVLAKKAQDGTADDTLSVMQQVAQLGPMAKAGFKQIGEKDTLFGYAAGLAYAGNDFNVAADIVRGEKRMKNDKDVKAAIGQTENDTIAKFQSMTGNAFAGTELGTTIRKAAEAYYVEKYLARGGATVGRFSETDFAASVNAVLGGNASPDKLAIGNINGAQMKLPQGVTKEIFTGALDQMGAEDYAASSKWGGPPRFTDGTIAAPKDIANEGKFQWIGGNEYRIRMSDGSFLMSGVEKLPNGTVRGIPFIFQADAKAIGAAAARRSTADQIRAAQPPLVP